MVWLLDDKLFYKQIRLFSCGIRLDILIHNKNQELCQDQNEKILTYDFFPFFGIFFGVCTVCVFSVSASRLTCLVVDMLVGYAIVPVCYWAIIVGYANVPVC